MRRISSKMRFVLAIFVLVCMASFVMDDFQGDVLDALRNLLNASFSQLTDWNRGHVTPCIWSNIICDSSYNVVSVTLSSMGLAGNLSPRIEVLKSLNALLTQGNEITGEIPTEFGYFTSLTSLDLENNRLSEP